MPWTWWWSGCGPRTGRTRRKLAGVDEGRRTRYVIGSGADCDIRIRDERIAEHHATIAYDRGEWIVRPETRDCPVEIGGAPVPTEGRALEKHDVLWLGAHKIYWTDYYVEPREQELYLRDFTTLRGRVNRSNFRALSLLCAGVAICIFFLPGLLAARASHRRLLNMEAAVSAIYPIVYGTCYPLLGLLLVSLAVKRMRDTGFSPYLLLVPGINLYLLYFRGSAR